MKIKQTEITVKEREALCNTEKKYICLSRNVKKHPGVKQHDLIFFKMSQ